MVGAGGGAEGASPVSNNTLVAIILRLTVNSFARSSSAARWQPDLLMRWCDRGLIRRAEGVVWGTGWWWWGGTRSGCARMNAREKRERGGAGQYTGSYRTVNEWLHLFSFFFPFFFFFFFLNPGFSHSGFLPGCVVLKLRCVSVILYCHSTTRR